jgi:hypothetical protein
MDVISADWTRLSHVHFGGAKLGDTTELDYTNRALLAEELGQIGNGGRSRLSVS